MTQPQERRKLRDRAGTYFLLERIFNAPDERLLSDIAATAKPDPAPGELRILDEQDRRQFDAALRVLQRLSKSMQTTDVEREYESVIRGLEPPDLALASSPAVTQFVQATSKDAPTEFVARVFFVMRHLIAQHGDREIERDFFDEFVAGGVKPLCSRIRMRNDATFYPAAAYLASVFIASEEVRYDADATETTSR